MLVNSYIVLVLCKIIFVLASDLECQNNCLRKCCPDGQSFYRGKNGTNCSGKGTMQLDQLLDLTPYNIIHGKTCPEGHAKIMIDKFKMDGVTVVWEGRTFNSTNSCVESYNNTLVAIICAVDEDVMEIVAYTGMIISMPFLLATFIAYALLPDRNLHMKALMFYVINLMLSYLLLVIIQLTDSRFSQGVCTSIGYFCLLFFLVSFFWMNVICIDIWFTFSGLRGFTGSKKSAERKRFFMYSAYAWAVPILHVLIVYIIDTNSKENSWFSPGIGKGQCFLRRGYPELLYFYGPMAILITINIILFAVTAFKIRSIKKETSMLKKEDSKRHSYENDKQTFNLYLKLLFAMGVNWSMEIISWAVIWSGKAPDAIWYLTDFCNAIYGVFIFFIFVFKRSIWKLLKKRYYTFIGKPYLAHSMTMTNTTRVTSYSTANSSVAENPHGVHDTSTLTSEA
ncbi:G-protein coupled receptor Mth2-like isoform X7 [Tenebrio molitor]|uniref:G-protein coupled receptor Mth2-like isoform X7 n=1 Tax=Tenebrio molitor TaxID=7067 RepID=UPI003624A33B